MVAAAATVLIASAEKWLGSRYLDRLVIRIASDYRVPAADLPDLIQETRIALWRTGLDVPVSSALVVRIARNKAVDLVRDLARRRTRHQQAARAAVAREEDPELHLLLNVRTSSLPQRLREFCKLHYELGLSERAIAQACGLSRGSVRRLDRQCRRLLVDG